MAITMDKFNPTFGGNEMSDIFLSYKSEDRTRAKIIAEIFEGHGYSVWWDRIIPPGKTFDQVIEEALDAAKCVVVLWSRDSVSSDWVKNEAREGAKRHILVPILIDNVKIPFEFGHIQAAQLIDWQGALPNPELDILLKSVGTILGKQVERIEDKNKTAIEGINNTLKRKENQELDKERLPKEEEPQFIEKWKFYLMLGGNCYICLVLLLDIYILFHDGWKYIPEVSIFLPILTIVLIISLFIVYKIFRYNEISIKMTIINILLLSVVILFSLSLGTVNFNPPGIWGAILVFVLLSFPSFWNLYIIKTYGKNPKIK